MSGNVINSPKEIRLEGISVIKDTVDILSDITVSFPRGKTTVLMGPSGCGKSTLLKVAAGLIHPDTGNVFIEETNAREYSQRGINALRKDNGFAFEDGALWQNMTAFENVSLPLKLHFPHLSEVEIRRRVDLWIKKIGFWDSTDLRPAKLSRGEQKMLSIIRALITDPSLVFMDSPTLSLDQEVAKNVLSIIRDLKRQGRTLIVSTHDPGLTSFIADYLLIINRGRMLTFGPFGEVVKSTDQGIVSILTEVLSQTSTYDTDLLDLLERQDGSDMDLLDSLNSGENI